MSKNCESAGKHWQLRSREYDFGILPDTGERITAFESLVVSSWSIMLASNQGELSQKQIYR